jgi:hypothetical protein
MWYPEGINRPNWPFWAMQHPEPKVPFYEIKILSVKIQKNERKKYWAKISSLDFISLLYALEKIDFERFIAQIANILYAHEKHVFNKI